MPANRLHVAETLAAPGQIQPPVARMANGKKKKHFFYIKLNSKQGPDLVMSLAWSAIGGQIWPRAIGAVKFGYPQAKSNPQRSDWPSGGIFFLDLTWVIFIIRQLRFN